MHTLFTTIQRLIKGLFSLNVLSILSESVYYVRFFLLIVFYLFFDLVRIIFSLPILRLIAQPLRPTGQTIKNTTLHVFDARSNGNISSLDLIHLAISHLKAKKTRTFITIGGMSIGFGAVIFLLSLGYGTQRLVISRVARLDEMKQIDVTVGKTVNLFLNDTVISDIEALDSVNSVLPMVAAVAKVNYNNSTSDIVLYGVSKQYLEASAIQPVQGTLFVDGELVSASNEDAAQGSVAGASISISTSASMNKEVSHVSYSIYPTVWKKVYASPSKKSQLLGYTKRIIGNQNAVEVWGDPYAEESSTILTGTDLYGNSFQPWIRDSFPIWIEESCSSEQNPRCLNNQYLAQQSGSGQSIALGYIDQDDVALHRYQIVSQSTQIQEGMPVSSITFSLPIDTKTQLYSNARFGSELTEIFAGQTDVATPLSGELVYGEQYADSSGWGYAGSNSNGQTLGFWIKASIPQWRKLDCEGCEDMYLVENDEQGNQKRVPVYIPASRARISNLDKPPRQGSVLGDTTDATSSAAVAITSPIADESESSATPSASISTTIPEVIIQNGIALQQVLLPDGTIEWSTQASESAVPAESQEPLRFPDNAVRQAVVNRAMLTILGLDESKAVGESFLATIRLDDSFFDDQSIGRQTEETSFTIAGVIPDEKTPAFYIPFTDIKNLGVSHYTQLKVSVDEQNDVAGVRERIESLGYRTASVVDTVGRINSLFATIKIVLSIVGFIALAVASLGMFNTLTVSLLEKTREVGLMKVIGMKSQEVRRLFLAESIVMGLSGGLFGLTLSLICGQVLNLVLSSFALTKGLGYIDIIFIPIGLALGTVLLSFFIGLLTGLYPSRRATKISALNALRYE